MTTPKRYPVRALIFDLDGTLIDSKLDLIHSVNAMLTEMGREKLSDDVISSYIGHGAPMLVSRALGGVAKEDELSRGLAYFLEYYEEHKLDNTCLYPEVAATLEKLGRQKIAMAVLTNKPDPQGANAILNEFRVRPTNAMMVGDSEVDIQTARNADMIATAVNFGFGIHDRARHPADIYLDCISDLLQVVETSH